MILAATGHRPHKLGVWNAGMEAKLRLLAVKVLTALKPEQAISGMALGWDLAWAEAALELNIPLIAAIPFRGQEEHWAEEQAAYYRLLLQRAARVEVVCTGPYAAYKNILRNEWMVDHCDVLIALWDGSDSGTGACVEYAERKKRPVKNLWAVWKAM